jgi:hypothetical protein
VVEPDGDGPGRRGKPSRLHPGGPCAEAAPGRQEADDREDEPRRAQQRDDPGHYPTAAAPVPGTSMPISASISFTESGMLAWPAIRFISAPR